MSIGTDEPGKPVAGYDALDAPPGALERGTNIDPKIKPVVDALNAIAGIRTLASCQGHSYGIEGKPPYVYFKAPIRGGLEGKSVIWRAGTRTKRKIHE